MRYKILILDELSPYLTFIKNVLLKEGFEIFVSSSESELLSSLDTRKPELILLDVQMNKGEGFEFLKRIKLDMKSNTPVIVISSIKNIKEIERAFDYGAYDYLIKPLNLRDLKNKINKALEKGKKEKNSYYV